MIGTHYYNTKTGQWVFKDSKGNFVTGFKLSDKQVRNLKTRRNIS